jgi:hypothetical protein
MEIENAKRYTIANAGYSNAQVSKSNFLNKVTPKIMAIIENTEVKAFLLFIVLGLLNFSIRLQCL